MHFCFNLCFLPNPTKMAHGTAPVPHPHDGHIRATYQDIHTLIGKTAQEIKAKTNPDIIIAIGGGGFIRASLSSLIPARSALVEFIYFFLINLLVR